jgi:hypothetical protein
MKLMLSTMVGLIFAQFKQMLMKRGFPSINAMTAILTK